MTARYCLHCGHLIVPSGDDGWRHSTELRARLCGMYATPDPCTDGCDPDDVHPVDSDHEHCDRCDRVWATL